MNRDQDVENFIGGMLELNGLNTVDTDDNKYIRVKSDDENNGKIESIITADGEKPLAIYGTKATDAAIINPFVEGDAGTPLGNWFYTTRNTQLSCIIRVLITKVLEAATRSKKGKKSNEQPYDKYCSRYISGDISSVTQKTVDEFNSLFKSDKAFFNIFYKNRERVGKINCLLFASTVKKTYPNIRVGSWEIFQSIFLNLLGIKSLDDLDYNPESPNVPVLESFCNILLKIYSNLQEPIKKLLGREIVGIEALQEHLKNLDAYYQTAKWCATTTSVVAPVQEQPNVLPPAIQANVNAPWATSAVAGSSDLPPAIQANMGAQAPVQYQPIPMPVVGSGLPPAVQANIAGQYASMPYMQM